MLKLDDLRAKAGFIFTAFMWAHVPFVAWVGYVTGQNTLILPMFVASLALVSTLSYRVNSSGAQSAMVTSTAAALVVAVLVFQLRGHPWQTDVHMYFFAGLALMTIYSRWQAIAAFTTVVALHHLLLNYLLPEAVFPGGGDLGRVILHATILLIEAVPLGALAILFERMFAANALAVENANKAKKIAEAMTEEKTVQETQLGAVITNLASGLQSLSQGNLSTRIGMDPGTAFPEMFSGLAGDFNTLSSHLKATISEVSEAASTVFTASGETAAAAQEIARKAESQANTVNEAVHHLNELNTSLAQSSALAAETADAVENNRIEAERGGVALNDAVAAMARIEHSSHTIRHSVDAIDDIAFQTNLLALNAGVEAARAGDSASGFAVVAQEVRSLAQRASESAAEIRRLILDSEGHVSNGSAVVMATATALRSVIDSSSTTADLVKSMATRTNEQFESLQRLTQGVTGLEMSAQHFAGTAEETTATTISLHEQASALKQCLHHFSLSHQDEAAPNGPTVDIRAA